MRYYGFQEFDLVRKFDPFHSIQNFVDKKYKHQVHIEDFWADCKNDREVRKRAHKRLTIEQMKSIGDIYVPLEVQEDDKLLHHSYAEARLAPITEPDWSEPWNTSLDVLSESVILFSKTWLKDKIEELKAEGKEITYPKKGRKRQAEPSEDLQCFYEKKRKIVEAKIVEKDKNTTLMDPDALGIIVAVALDTFVDARSISHEISAEEAQIAKEVAGQQIRKAIPISLSKGETSKPGGVIGAQEVGAKLSSILSASTSSEPRQTYILK